MQFDDINMAVFHWKHYVKGLGYEVKEVGGEIEIRQGSHAIRFDEQNFVRFMERINNSVIVALNPSHEFMVKQKIADIMEQS